MIYEVKLGQSGDKILSSHIQIILLKIGKFDAFCNPEIQIWIYLVFKTGFIHSEKGFILGFGEDKKK